MNDTYVLQMEGIEKEYSGVKVLRGIDLQVRPGEVVSIVGENGAGKSTLMNILFGMPVIHSTGGFKGSVRLCGEEVRITSPEKAIEFGIGMVHQEFMLLPNFTVAENIKINRENIRSAASSADSFKRWMSARTTPTRVWRSIRWACRASMNGPP